MNIVLFIDQLNLLLQTSPIENTLWGICDLLRTHTSAGVKITDNNGNTIVELTLDELNDTHNILQNITLPIINGQYDISLARNGKALDKDETIAVGITISISTILLRQLNTKNSTEQKRRREAVRNLLNTLTFSELEAAAVAVRELQTCNFEGILVAGHIADQLGFARSVVTSALKKLEGAGLAETRSLGMKGTFIRVKEKFLVDELMKL